MNRIVVSYLVSVSVSLGVLVGLTILKPIHYTDQEKKIAARLGLLEHYRKGTLFGATLISCGVGSLGLSSFKKSYTTLTLIMGLASICGGSWFYLKSYLKDPFYRRRITEKFYASHLRESVASSGWSELFDVIPLHEIRYKVTLEMGKNPNLSSIWAIFGEDIIRDLIKFDLIERSILHDLCYREISSIGFLLMVEKYHKWFLDDEILAPEEISPFFRDFFNNTSDAISFFQKHMEWPVLQYKEKLGLNSSELQNIKALYEIYLSAEKAYSERLETIAYDYLQMKTLLEREEELAIKKVKHKKEKAKEKFPNIETYKKEIQEIEKEWQIKRQQIQNEQQIKLLPLKKKMDEETKILKINYEEVKMQIQSNFQNLKKSIPFSNINVHLIQSPTVETGRGNTSTSPTNITIINQVTPQYVANNPNINYNQTPTLSPQNIYPAVNPTPQYPQYHTLSPQNIYPAVNPTPQYPQYH